MLEHELLAAEALELHCFLDNHNIINKVYDDIDGPLEDEHGKYYILSLVERVELLVKYLAATNLKSEIAWTPINLSKE